MKGMNIIQLNALHLNVVLLNGDEMPGEVVVGGGEVVPVPPTEPETPDVPVEPKKFILSASVANGVVSATLNGVVVSLPYTANEGDVIVVEVTPNDGYAFEGWADGNTDNPRSITMNADVVLSAECIAVPSESKYIQFEDAEVERVLMSKGVSSDGVGITMEDAAKVTSIDKWFQNNTAITSFDEFEYFTGVTKLVGEWNSGAFYGCTNLKSIKFPPSLSSLGNDCFMNCSNLSIDVDIPNLAEVGYGVFHATRIKRIVNLGRITSIGNAGSSSSHTFAGMCPDLSEVILPKTLTALGNKAFTENPNMEKVISYAVTPPSLGNYVFSTLNSALVIYVPDASLEAYKTATNWNQFADRIHPLSEIEGMIITQNNTTDADFFVMRTSDNKTRKYKQFNVSQASSYSMSMSVASGSPIKGCLHIKRSGGWADNEVDSGWITGGMSKVVTDDMDADRSCSLIGVGFTYVSNNDGVPTMEEIRQYITFQIEIF